MLATISQVYSMALRPFRQETDVETLVLILLGLTMIAGLWHVTLERIEL